MHGGNGVLLDQYLFFSFLCCLLHDDGDDGDDENDENDDRDGTREGIRWSGIETSRRWRSDLPHRCCLSILYLVLQGSYSGMLGTILSPLLTTSTGTDLLLFLSAPYFPI